MFTIIVHLYTRITVFAYLLYYIIYISGLAPRSLSREEGRMAITNAVSALTAFRTHIHTHTHAHDNKSRPWNRIIYI